MPLMRDIVQNWTGTGTHPSRFNLEPTAGAVTYHYRFVWVAKSSYSVSWFASQLDKVIADVESLRNEGHDVAVDISIYITCDDAWASDQSSTNGDRVDTRGEITQTRSNEYEEKNIASHTAELSSRSSSSRECCCARTISNEDAVTAACTCGSQSQIQRISSSSSFSLHKSNRIVDPRIPLFVGRPHVENIIRKEAEHALGEMAVVVCGPPGLVQRTRNAVVKVSDEHKGTGAQGIYVHA
jgi:hypothetical protein